MSSISCLCLSSHHRLVIHHQTSFQLFYAFAILLIPPRCHLLTIYFFILKLHHFPSIIISPLGISSIPMSCFFLTHLSVHLLSLSIHRPLLLLSNDPSIHLLINWLIHSFIRSFIHSFIHSIHSDILNQARRTYWPSLGLVCSLC